jgi:hypothetical protein
MQKSWLAMVTAFPRKALTGAIAQVKKRYAALKNRYGPRYTKAMLLAAFIALFVPIPGSALLAVGLVVVIAEGHRAMSKKRGPPEAITDQALVVKANAPA